MKHLLSVILITGGLLRMGDFASDTTYLLTVSFYSDLFFYLCLGFLVLPSLPTLLLVTCAEIFTEDKKTKLGKFKIILGILMSAGEQFGLVSVSFGVFYLFRPARAEKYSVLHLTRYTAILHSIFESMPSTVIQIINCGNQLISPKILIISCLFSGFSIIFTILRVVYLFDKALKVEKSVEMSSAVKYLEREAWRNTDFTLEQFK